MTSRDATKAIPPEKRCYYDAAALKKRVARAARTLPRSQPTYLIFPPNLPAPRMHLVFFEEQLAQENYQYILRPRLHEHFRLRAPSKLTMVYTHSRNDVEARHRLHVSVGTDFLSSRVHRTLSQRT
jgi:hypothetical protein